VIDKGLKPLATRVIDKGLKPLATRVIDKGLKPLVYSHDVPPLPIRRF